jgi:flagellin
LRKKSINFRKYFSTKGVTSQAQKRTSNREEVAVSNSIQTNVDSIIAQNNLQTNNQFKSQTIQRLTSGYRINSSSDDAAGLAVANQFRSDVAELTQGVRNANDGISALQIVDGGLSNISTMLDRLKTLATESATDTFSGNRGTLNTEYQTLLGEINRQAQNVGLSSGAGVGARYSKNIGVYIGGSAGVQANAVVNVDMGGSKVDSAGLGIQSTNILGGASSEFATAVDLSGGGILASSATQVFTVRTSVGTTNVTIAGPATTAGLSSSDVVNQFNQQLTGTGISAAIGSDGKMQFFGGDTAFSIDAAAASSGTGVASALTPDLTNANLNNSVLSTGVSVAGDTLNFNVNGNSITVTLGAAESSSTIASKVNSALNAYGIQAVLDSAGTSVNLEGTTAFTVSMAGTGTEALAAQVASTAGASNTANANSAIAALTSAVNNLGLVQGKVGTGQNQLQYAVDLANSQISSFSAASSRIRDADVAAEASNLTKAQVLQQSSIAALAQANQEPQALLSLLKG